MSYCRGTKYVILILFQGEASVPSCPCLRVTMIVSNATVLFKVYAIQSVTFAIATTHPPGRYRNVHSLILCLLLVGLV